MKCIVNAYGERAIYEWEYDEVNNLTKESACNENQLLEKVYQYDAANNLTKILQYDNGYLLREYEFVNQYDERDNLICKDIHVERGGTKYVERTVWKYDNNNNIISYMQGYYDYSEDKFHPSIQYEYDKMGNLLKK